MSDTIAAVATGNGKSAIGILRLSGDRAIACASAVFRPNRYASLADVPAGRLVNGALLGRDGAVIDLCLATVSRAPHSYTGEDTAELQCHGSPAVLAEALAALFAAGARQAEAGEFTRRAFLNGKMDLVGAEAVADLIDAPSAAAARNAAGQLGGAVSRKAARLYEELVSMVSHFQAEVDFPDDDIEPFLLAAYRDTLAEAERDLRALAATYERGRYLREGIPCAIVGKPNAGKSSLLNALVGFDRAIVTARAGTTRDTVEETALLGGLMVRLGDTAGLRDTEDEAEEEGVRRAERAAGSAALVLGVFDGSRPLSPEDERTLALLGKAPVSAVLVNKSDLPQALETELLAGPWPILPVSAKTGAGLEALGELVAARFAPEDVRTGEILTGVRQAQCVSRAADAVGEAARAIDAGVAPDAVLTLCEEAMDALASLLGRRVRDDVVADIFSRFCVGK